MAIQFAADGIGAIHRRLEIDKHDPVFDADSLDDIYELTSCVKWINENQYKHVALQFPDHMLVDSKTICFAVKEQCDCQLYVLADTSYGSCCVDEIAAEHVSADAIIHFGHSCLSPTNRLPALYVFGKKRHDLEDAEAQFQELFPKKDEKIIILYDVIYSHLAELLHEKLISQYSHVVLSRVDFNELKLSTARTSLTECCSSCSDKKCCSTTKASRDTDSPESPETIKLLGRTIKLLSNSKIEDYCAFYVGQEGNCLLNLMITFNKCEFYSYDPEEKSRRKETLSVNKTLMKRYYLIERAKDADIVGILIGTLGVTDYLSIIKQLKQMIKDSGKKVYTLVVGKINVAKLANFPEIDVFVLVACPENSLIDSKDFLKPIVTPFEMEIACNAARSWTGDYITDFRQLLPGAADYVQHVASTESEISLISGRLRVQNAAMDTVNDDQKAIMKKDDNALALIHDRAAGAFLSDRSWKGLETDFQTSTEVEKASKGRHGTATGYENEGEVFKKNAE